MKLALGYTAVIIAAITFALDYKYGFEATKKFTTAAVVAYFLLNGAFTYWIWGVEKGLIYVGAWKGRKVSPLPYCSILLFQQLTCTKTDHHHIPRRQVRPYLQTQRHIPPFLPQHHPTRRQGNLCSLHAMVHR